MTRSHRVMGERRCGRRGARRSRRR